jgi:hypothetical protein
MNWDEDIRSEWSDMPCLTSLYTKKRLSTVFLVLELIGPQRMGDSPIPHLESILPLKYGRNIAPTSILLFFKLRPDGSCPEGIAFLVRVDAIILV